MNKHYFTLLLTILLAVSASAQTAPIEKTLRNIILSSHEEGEGVGEIYTITGKLYGVYVPPRYKHIVFAKDNKQNVNPSTPSDEQIEDDIVYDNYRSFDQSNWIQLLFPEGTDASAFVGKEIPARTFTGRINVVSLVANGPVGLYIEANHQADPTTFADFSYTPNLYNCANFVQQEWFFVKPKNLEYCNIHWAIYNGDNKFYVPDASEWPGSFKVNMALWEQQTDDNSVTADDVFQVGHAYEFPAIIQFSVDNQLTLNIDPGFDGDINYGDPPTLRGEAGFSVGQPGTLPEGYRNVVVYPLSIKEDLITAVDQVETTREVVGVQYYDLQGRMSNAPLKGVNIKVTTYSDGSQETNKIIK